MKTGTRLLIEQRHKEWHPWEVFPRGPGKFIVVQRPVNPNRTAHAFGKGGNATVYSSRDSALSKALQLNMEDQRIKRHAFEPAPIEPGKRVPRCKHCGLPTSHARAHTPAQK